jgi:hypothetical protein
MMTMRRNSALQLLTHIRVCSRHTTTIRNAAGGDIALEGRGRGGRGGQPGMGEAASDDPAHAAFPAASHTRTETSGDGFCTSHALPQHVPEAASDVRFSECGVQWMWGSVDVGFSGCEVQ